MILTASLKLQPQSSPQQNMNDNNDPSPPGLPFKGNDLTPTHSVPWDVGYRGSGLWEGCVPTEVPFLSKKQYSWPVVAAVTSQPCPTALERSSCLQEGLGGARQIHRLHRMLNMRNAHRHPATHVGYSLWAPGLLWKSRASYFKFSGLTVSSRRDIYIFSLSC